MSDKLWKIVYSHLSEVAQIGRNPITDRHIEELDNLFNLRDQQIVLAELEYIEAISDCIEDQCGLDANLLRDNFLRRISELKQAQNKEK